MIRDRLRELQQKNKEKKLEALRKLLDSSKRVGWGARIAPV